MKGPRTPANHASVFIFWRGVLYWNNRVFNRRNKINTIAYIDGQNFLYGAAEALLNAGIIADKQDVSSIDIRYLLKDIPQSEDAQIRYYGVARISKLGGEEDEVLLDKFGRFTRNLRILKSYLQKTDIEYRGIGILKVRDRDECKRCGAQDIKFQEKGVDVGLAVELVKDVLLRQVDHIILVSSDTDLMPALRIAKEYGVRVTYVAFDGRVVMPMRRLSDQFWILDAPHILEAYARSLTQFRAK